MPGNSNYDAINTVTLETYAETTLRDNIFDSSAFLRLMKERRHVTTKGGSKVLEPIMFGRNSTAGSYSGYDPLDNAPQSGLTNAEFQWKQNYASVIISGLEDEVQNTGDSAVLDLLESKMAQAEESLIRVMNQQLYADGTGNGGKDIVGLDLGIDAAGTYGNINRTSETYWAAQEAAAGGALAIEGSSVSMQRVFDLCSKGGGKQAPDLALTTRKVYEAFEQFFTPDRRFADDKLASYGFITLKFKGACDVTWEEDCTAETLFFVNTKTWKFVSHPNRNFKVDGPKYPTNEDSKIWHILWAGALTCNEPRRNGKITGITNA